MVTAPQRRSSQIPMTMGWSRHFLRSNMLREPVIKKACACANAALVPLPSFRPRRFPSLPSCSLPPLPDIVTSEISHALDLSQAWR